MKVSFPFLCLLLATSVVYAQTQHAKPEILPNSPLRQLTHTFPRSIAVKNQGHLIEFCPDNTCDAFSAVKNVSQSALEDLAYLFESYFSEFAYLEDWRAENGVEVAAQQILAKPEYRHGHAESGRSAARCIIEEIGGQGRVRLLFIRYDEHHRNVVPGNLTQELSRAK